MKQLLLFFILLSQLGLGAQTEYRATFQSQYLNSAVPYQIWLPENYDAMRDQLGLMVLLDGDEYIGIAKSTTVLYHFGERSGPNVILSLPSTEASRWQNYTPSKAAAGNDGQEDEKYALTGNFRNFANFIAVELLPFIQQQYNLQFQRKSIFGHSMGGLAVLSFMVLQPELFDHYISASPSTMYDEHFILKAIEEQKQFSFQSLFLSAASDDANGYRENVNWLFDFLKKHKNATQRIGKSIYQGENHATSGLKSFIDGLAFIYQLED